MTMLPVLTSAAIAITLAASGAIAQTSLRIALQDDPDSLDPALN